MRYNSRMPKDITLPKGTIVPNHLAIIPDGNRRWARARGLHTFEGHRRGFDMAVKICRQARKWGIHTITLWGFSTENWDRTPAEISYLMKLYHKLIDDYIKEAHKYKVRIYHLGRRDRLPTSLIKKIDEAMEVTKKYKKYIMNIALDYGGRDEILRSFKEIINDKVPASKINAKLVDSYSDLAGQPYPNVDLMIRTSGEQRTSGFLMWHADYNEFYWADVHFPDFDPAHLKDAVLDYSRRRRRFGGNDAMEHFKFNPGLTAKLELSWWRLKNVPEGMRLRDYMFKHLKEQYGLSKSLAKDAARLMIEAFAEEKVSKFEKAKGKMKKFYTLLKNELKLAFEPRLVASLDVNLDRENGEDEETTKEYLAEVYRISEFQAAKAAHLRVLANIERNKGNWGKAEDYLRKYYHALKERVA